MKKMYLLLCLLWLPALAVQAGWQDFLKQQIDTLKTGQTPTVSSASRSALSQEEMIAGLKEALLKGVDTAVGQLGKSGGFLNNANVRIPMPESLSRLEQLLRRLGQDQYADEFVNTMNHAAEKAVPLTLEVLKTGVRKMSIADAKSILQGSDTAATDYLRKIGSAQMRDSIAPIVKQATDQTGVTQKYKQLYSNLGFMGNFMKPEDYDIDRYVTDKTLDGLFTLIAEEEKAIRKNPVARTTDLLKKVFAGNK